MHERRNEVDDFIVREIDTVPHLEALLLFWSSRPRLWNVDEMAAKLYVSGDESRSIVESLARRGFVAEDQQQQKCFRYRQASAAKDALMAALEIAYKQDLIRITRMIHAKAPASVREFARAFRFKVDRKDD